MECATRHVMKMKIVVTLYWFVMRVRALPLHVAMASAMDMRLTWTAVVGSVHLVRTVLAVKRAPTAKAAFVYKAFVESQPVMMRF